MYGKAREYNRKFPSSLRAELVSPGGTGWSVRTESGDLMHGISTSMTNLQATWWVTMIRVGETWNIVGVTNTAPDGGG